MPNRASYTIWEGSGFCVFVDGHAVGGTMPEWDAKAVVRWLNDGGDTLIPAPREPRATDASPLLSRDELDLMRARVADGTFDDLHMQVLIDHIDAISDQHEALVQATNQEAEADRDVPEGAMLSMTAVDMIRRRADAATPGPWAHAHGSWVIASSVPQGASKIASGEYGEDAWRFYGGELICESISSDDAEFVAHARQDVPALLDHIECLTDAYNDLVSRSADEADRTQALVLHKEEELAAHADLHQQAANSIERLMRQLALRNEEAIGAREIIRLALAAMREPLTHTDARRAREILTKYHHECAVAAARTRQASAPFPSAPGASL